LPADNTNSADYKVGLTAVALATLNPTASAKDTHYDIYTVTLDGTSSPISFQRNVNVAATIGGKDVVDVTYFGSDGSQGAPYNENALSAC
jgi:hypothetical protein